MRVGRRSHSHTTAGMPPPSAGVCCLRPAPGPPQWRWITSETARRRVLQDIVVHTGWSQVGAHFFLLLLGNGWKLTAREDRLSQGPCKVIAAHILLVWSGNKPLVLCSHSTVVWARRPPHLPTPPSLPSHPPPCHQKCRCRESSPGRLGTVLNNPNNTTTSHHNH